jgi:hypothetical protein
LTLFGSSCLGFHKILACLSDILGDFYSGIWG